MLFLSLLQKQNSLVSYCILMAAKLSSMQISNRSTIFSQNISLYREKIYSIKIEFLTFLSERLQDASTKDMRLSLLLQKYSQGKDWLIESRLRPIKKYFKDITFFYFCSSCFMNQSRIRLLDLRALPMEMTLYFCCVVRVWMIGAILLMRVSKAVRRVSALSLSLRYSHSSSSGKTILSRFLVITVIAICVSGQGCFRNCISCQRQGQQICILYIGLGKIVFESQRWQHSIFCISSAALLSFASKASIWVAEADCWFIYWMNQSKFVYPSELEFQQPSLKQTQSQFLN